MTYEPLGGKGPVNKGIVLLARGLGLALVALALGGCDFSRVELS